MHPETQQLVQKLAQELGVSPQYALLLLERETGSQKDPMSAISNVGARGPLQVMPNTGNALAAQHGFDFNTPEGQTRAGLLYYKDLLGQFNNDPAVAAAAYHSGPTRVRQIQSAGGDLATELGPVGRDYYSWFKDRTAGADGLDTATAPTPSATPDPALDAVATFDDADQVADFEAAPTAPQPAPAPPPAFDGIPEFSPEDPSAAAAGQTEAYRALRGAGIEATPAVGGAVGGMLGGPPGAALGAGGGEAVRQLLRRAMGEKEAAPGFVQGLTDVDPNSPLAAILGIGAEAATGGAFEKAAGYAASKIPGIRERAAKLYSTIFRPTSAAEHAREAGALTPILDELPTGGFLTGRERINAEAGKQAAASGEKVAQAYARPDIESSFKPTVDELRGLADEEVETAGDWMYLMDAQGNVHKEWMPAAIRNPGRYGAYRGRAQELAKGELTRDTIGTGPINIEDVFKRRKAAADLMNDVDKAMGAGARDLNPLELALKTERQSLSDTLHTASGEWTTSLAKQGEVADAIHSAWKTVQGGTSGTGNEAASIARWAISRGVGGPTGTGLGFIANQGTFWKSLGANKLLQLSRLIKAGKDTEAEHLLRIAYEGIKGYDNGSSGNRR